MPVPFKIVVVLLLSMCCADAQALISSATGTVFADQAAGADMCVKINNAALSLGPAGGVVDASRFPGAQPCSVDPSTGVTSPVAVILGSTTIQTTVAWNIVNGRFEIKGAGSQATALQYVGSNDIASVLTLGESSPVSNTANFIGYRLEGLRISGNSHAVDGVTLQGVHHSTLSDLVLWAVTGCAIHTKFAVSDTFLNLHVSKLEAQKFGIATLAPQHGLCLDEYSAKYQTTDGTVIDLVVEGVTQSGWYLASAASMHFSAGTSESNGMGIEIGPRSFSNTFTSSDLEGNTQDVIDSGYFNVYVNPLSTTSMRFTASAHDVTFVGGTLNSLLIDSGASRINYSGAATGNNGGGIVNRSLSTTNLAAGGITAASLASQGFAGIPVDAVSDTFTTQRFAPGVTVALAGVTPIAPSSAWKLLLTGTWQNNWEGGGLDSPAAISEVTSSSPTLNIGSVPITFAVNSAGEFTASNGSNLASAIFAGHILAVPYSGVTNPGTHSLNMKGKITGDVMQATRATPANSSEVCEAKSIWADANFLYVCADNHHLKRVMLGSF